MDRRTFLRNMGLGALGYSLAPIGYRGIARSPASTFPILHNVVAPATAKWPILCSSYGEGVNWSLVFDVFAFKICADPFAPVGAGGGEKFNLFKPRAGTLACPYC
ncbi:hypothetical protein ES703_122484 [subsurface metagenome]